MSQNIFPIDFEEKNTIANNDFILFSDSEDGNKLKKAQYSNLKWEKWDPWTPWAAATITVWTTTTGNPWTSASVTNSGTSSAAVLDFTIPKGADWVNGNDWAAATIAVGTVTTVDPDDPATVTNSWTSSAAIFDFEIPQWDTWPTWNWISSISSTKAWKTTTVTITETNGDDYSFQVQDWADGQWAWDVTWPNSSTDWNIAVFDWASWKIIKDSWVAPTVVVDALNSSSATSALSANQGKVLNDKISDLMWLGKFLSLWDATTWLPDSFPLETPYTYTTWDYFLVETVSTATPPVNYKPNGSSYTGTASTTTESDELEAWDVYIYDGSVRLLQSNHWKTVSFSNIAWDAMDNANLSWYLNMKAFNLPWTTWSSNIAIAQAAFEWQLWGKTAIIVYNNKPYAYTGWNTAYMTFASMFYREQLEASNDKTSLVRDSITFSVTWGTTVSSISAWAWNNVIASVIKTDTDYATPYTPQYNGSPATKKYVDDKSPVVSSTTPSTPTEWMIWYDTINDVLKTYDWSSWAEAGGGDAKVFEITWFTGDNLTIATAAYTWAYTNWKCAIIRFSNRNYVYSRWGSTYAYFSMGYGYGAVSSGTWAMRYSLKLTVSDWSVTAISADYNQINISSSAPASWTGNNVITLVI